MGSSAFREQFGVLGRQATRHVGWELAKPRAGMALDVDVLREAEGNPGIGPDHEALGVPDEEIAPRRIELAARRDVRPKGELDPEVRPGIHEAPDLRRPRA